MPDRDQASSTRAAWLTFVVVGAGPTGVEMAGQIAQIAREMRSDFRSVDVSEATAVLIETGDRVLSTFPPSLSAKALRSLGELGEDLSLPGYPEVIVIGDMVRVRRPDGSSTTLPGLAPVAMRQGRHAARVVGDRLGGRAVQSFRYVDKGNLATIGRGRAVAEVKGLRLSGPAAWLIWLTVHLWY